LADMRCYDMIYLNAIRLPRVASTIVHIYTQAIHRTSNQHKQYIQQNRSLIRKCADSARLSKI
jgi:hypothetical protein